MRYLLLLVALARAPYLLAATCQRPEAEGELKKAIQLAEAYNWSAAKAHFYNAQNQFAACGDDRNRTFAQIGFLRATMEQRNLATLSGQLQDLIDTRLIQNDPELRLWAYIAKGDVDQDMHYPAVARTDWESVKQLATETKNSKWTYRAEGELAIPAFYQGDVGTARTLVTKAIAAAVAAHDQPSYVRLLTHIGTVYAMWGDYSHASEHLDKALAIAQADQAEQDYPVTVQEGRLMVLLGQGQLAEAERLAKEVLEVEGREDRRVNEAQTLVTLGSVYRKEKRYDHAIQALDRGVRIAERGSYQQSLGNAEFALADLYRIQRNLTAAELHAARALTATHDSGLVSELPQRMAVLAALKAEEGKTAEAEGLYGKAENEIDSQLAFVPYSARGPLLQSESDIYTQHFALIAGHSGSVEQAYRIIERIRGRSMYGLLRTGILSQSSEDAGTEREIGALRLRLAQARTDVELTAIREEIFIAAHKRWLNNDELSVLRKSPDELYSLATVQRNLVSEEVLIEYMQTADWLYAVVITPQSAKVVKLARSSDVTTAAHAFLNAVNELRNAKQEGKVLWQLLFANVPGIERGTRLLIVPDAELYTVPFDALVDFEGRRLIESHTILRLPSASTYVLLRKRPAAPGKGGLLAVGGVRYNKDVSAIAALRGWDGKKLANLPSSEDEIVDAEKALSPYMAIQKLMHTDATETAFKNAQLSGRKIIHLAVHGQASPDSSDRAALFFLDDPATNEDGVLELPEIVRLPLRAELVVLSACDTAVGPEQGEDGVLGLNRAFLLAGTRAVIATLWRVDDTFSEKLIKSFYNNLAEGMTVSNALAFAQRDFVAHVPPYYWAGFILDGADTHIVPQHATTARQLN